jgi:hypothetical protein
MASHRKLPRQATSQRERHRQEAIEHFTRALFALTELAPDSAAAAIAYGGLGFLAAVKFGGRLACTEALEWVREVSG